MGLCALGNDIVKEMSWPYIDLCDLPYGSKRLSELTFYSLYVAAIHS